MAVKVWWYFVTQRYLSDTMTEHRYDSGSASEVTAMSLRSSNVIYTFCLYFAIWATVTITKYYTLWQIILQLLPWDDLNRIMI